jgi:predicted ATP-grasp superfamily ATP-dependent carboligase
MSEDYEEEGGAEESSKTPNVLLLESDSESSSESDDDSSSRKNTSTPLRKSGGSKSAPGSANKKKADKEKGKDKEKEKEKEKDRDRDRDKDKDNVKSEKQLRAERRRKEHAEIAVPYVVPKILLQREFGGVELSEFTNIDCSGAPIVSGFPSDGMASVLLANYFIEELGLPLVAQIVVPTFPTSCRIHKGQPSYATRIYGDRRVVVFVSEYQNLEAEPESMHGIVACLFDFAKRHRSSEIFMIEGLADKMENKDDDKKNDDVDIDDVLRKMEQKPTMPLRFITSNPDIAKKLVAKKYKPLRDAIIGGVSGGILSAASVHHDCNVTCLVVPYNPLLSDVRVSIEAVELISGELLATPIAIDVAPLVHKAERIEKKIKKALEQLTGSSNLRSSKEHSMYT